ncbi:hypothetical protein BD410DRAFT_812200 [Rickenella mellea]|uniref:Uncharacterized protein n=1 Tax=Rickenella mellea TaxID=50990 RepID=A0A4Y7QKK6_9AGAM|nr:hypothetical protein BD410DRAFT_812200 [Rickenella mellea]
MSVPPNPSAGRGEVTVQPSYFTSSLYVNPIRSDILRLIHTYNEAYALAVTAQPFGLFKSVWTRQGWQWLHLKVLDARARDSFLHATFRLFLEHTSTTEPLMSRVVGLFGFYIFYTTQPSTSNPSVHRVLQIPIPCDMHESLLAIPSALLSVPPLLKLKPYTEYLIDTLTSNFAFHILPHSSLQAQSPRTLPREIFEGEWMATEGSSLNPENFASQIKKAGRPTKAERNQRAKAALIALEKWLQKSTIHDSSAEPHSWAANGPGSENTGSAASQRPVASLETYRAAKARLLSSLNDGPISESSSALEMEVLNALSENDETSGHLPRPVHPALARANLKVLSRLKEIDAMAAERGLEVGGEGGDMTGLSRVERAANELAENGKGILGLLEGGGLLDHEGNEIVDE